MKAPSPLPGGLRRRTVLAATAAAALAACGGGGSGGLGVVALPVPVFGSPFAGDTPAADGAPVLTVTLLLTPRLPDASNGPFIDSALVVRIKGGSTDLNRYQVTGTFSGDDFTLDVAAASPPIALRYQGHFASADVIRLVPVAPAGSTAKLPTLELRRQAV